MLTRKQIMRPIWETDTVYDEHLMMLLDSDGNAAAPLLYMPKRILSVTDSTGAVKYEEGRDWTLEGRELRLTQNSRIFAFPPEMLYPPQPIPGHTFPTRTGYSLFFEGPFFHQHQIRVDYECECDWEGVRPQFAGALLPKTVSALRERRPFNLVLFGDSISACANATACLDIPPYQPDYGVLLYDELVRFYGGDIRYFNPSVGGMETNWAVDTLAENVLAHDPDLLILAFGMNDGAKTPEQFAANVRRIVENTRAVRPDCELILVATTLPNPLLDDPRAPFWGNQQYFRAALDSLAAENALGGGLAVADITGMHRYLLSRKRFIDLTTNNVNHPNDFLYRCQAQFLMQLLIPSGK